MTSNQLRNSELKETQRANLKREENEAKKRILDRENLKVTKRGQDMQLAGNLAKGIFTGLPKLNHPSWYKGVADSALTAANIPGYYPLGIAYTDNSAESKALVTATHIKITVADILPISRKGKPDINSGLSYMALTNFKYVRSKNSGSANYESVDLMMKDLSLISIAGGIAAIVRELRLSLTSNEYNKAVMTQLSKVNAASFADYVTRVNQQIARFNTLYLPNIFPILSRKLWLYSNIFADDNLNKTQWIKVMPKFIWRYDEVNGKLVADLVETNDDSAIIDKLLTAVTNAIDALFTSESIDIMAGDEQKAYGDDGNFNFSTISVDVSDIAPVYDDEIIQQLRSNTLLPGFASPVSDFDVNQLNGNLIYQGSPEGFYIHMFAIGSDVNPTSLISDFNNSYEKVILNFMYDTFNVDDVLTSSRFAFVGQSTLSSDKKKLDVKLMSAGTEIITSYKVGYIDQDGNNEYVEFIDQFTTLFKIVKTYSISPAELIVSKQLDTLPTIPYYQWDGSTSNVKFEVPLLIAPLDNFNIIEKKTIANLNEVCNQSLFGMVVNPSKPQKSEADGSWRKKKDKGGKQDKTPKDDKSGNQADTK